MAKKSNSNRGLFVRRFMAFFLDIVLVSTLAAIFTFPFLDYESIDNLSENFYQLKSDYANGEIDTNTYVSHSSSILYRLSRSQGILSLVTIFINILYFIVYQFYHKGQTIGKRLFGIRIESNDSKKLTMDNYIYRYFIINSILIDMIILVFVIFASQNAWFYGAGMLGAIDYIILVICGFMIIFRKDGRGLHDLVSNTKVIQYRK